MFGLKNLEEQRGFGKARTGYCKKLAVACLYDVSDSEFDAMSRLPNFKRELTITRDDVLYRLKEKIDSIFALEYVDNVHSMEPAQWTRYEREFLLTPLNMDEPLMPGYDVSDSVVIRLTEQQSNLLDYLRFEKRAAISGIGGSGKTVLARKKAERLASEGGRVLILCVTSKLASSLADKCSGEPLIKVQTIQSYATELKCAGASGRGFWIDHEKLADAILDMGEAFPFDHVIVDEAQDFGGDYERYGVLDALQTCVDAKGGCMYVFYDVLQAIFRQEFPKTITDFPCRLALYRNCRNSGPIAKTALSAALFAHGYTAYDHPYGPTPTVFVDADVDECAAHVSRTIERYSAEGVSEDDIVVISCRAVKKSLFSGIIEAKSRDRNYWPGTKVAFDSVWRFKGLESKAVIVVDADAEV